MTQETFKRVFLAATPFIAVLFLTVFYASFVSAFIKCTWGNAGCKSLLIENVLPSGETTNSPTGANNLAKNSPANRTLQVPRYSGRITWGFLMMTYMLLSLASIVVASVLIYKIFSDWGKRPSKWVLITLATSAAFGFLLYNSEDIYIPNVRHFMR